MQILIGVRIKCYNESRNRRAKTGLICYKEVALSGMLKGRFRLTENICCLCDCKYLEKIFRKQCSRYRYTRKERKWFYVKCPLKPMQRGS